MKKRIVMVMLSCMLIGTTIACNSKTTNTETKTDTETTQTTNNDDIDITDMSESEYEDYLVNETIRNQIMTNSPDLLKNVTDTITNDDFVTLAGATTNEDGTEETFSTECRKVSDLSVAPQLQEDLLKHKVGDTFETILPGDNDTEIPVTVTVQTVTDDPLNYFDDTWVKKYSGYSQYSTTDEYEEYVRGIIKAALAGQDLSGNTTTDDTTEETSEK